MTIIPSAPSLSTTIPEGTASLVIDNNDDVDNNDDDDDDDIEVTIDKIMNKLSLKEKISLCSGKDLWHLQGISHNIIQPIIHIEDDDDHIKEKEEEETMLPTGIKDDYDDDRKKEEEEVVLLELVPSIQLTDGPHGLIIRKDRKEEANLLKGRKPSTCFPTAVNMASTWNVELIEKVGLALRDECILNKISILLGPGMNIKRHPCCGRNFEYYSEDPFVTGKIGKAFVRGIQTDNVVGACIKHVCVNNQETNRFRTNSIVDDRTLNEIYLKGYEMTICEENQQPWTIMTAYNKLNGQYCSEHYELLEETIRNKWGFKGSIMTDWGATNNRIASIKVGLDLEMPGSYGAHDSYIYDAVSNGELTEEQIDHIVKRNIRLSLKAIHGYNAFIMKNKEFQEAEKKKEYEAKLYETNHQLAKQVALESIILLKNDDNILPIDISSSPSKIGIIGEFAKKPRYQGMGSSQVLPTKLDNAYDTLIKYVNVNNSNDSTNSNNNNTKMSKTNVLYARGYDSTLSYEKDDDDDDDDDDDNGDSDNHTTDNNDIVDYDLINEAIDIAKQSDVVIIFVGLPGICESEGFDRKHIRIPKQHIVLINEICSIRKDVVAVLSNGSVVEIPSLWISNNTNNQGPKAIVEGYLLGQGGGSAIIDILFDGFDGIDNVSPSGKLAETFPMTLNDVPSNSWFPSTTTTSMDTTPTISNDDDDNNNSNNNNNNNNHQVQYREGLNIGYRYFNNDNKSKKNIPVLFPFGHGLSYTTFSYSNIRTNVNYSKNKGVFTVDVTLKVKNVGKRPGKEVVQCYVHDIESSIYRPYHELKSFTKIFLKPNEVQTVHLTLDHDAFAFYDTGYKKFIVEEGKFEIQIGSSSRDIRLQSVIDIKKKSIITNSNSNSSSSSDIGNSIVQTPSQHARDSFPPDMYETATTSANNNNNKIDLPTFPLIVDDKTYQNMMGIHGNDDDDDCNENDNNSGSGGSSNNKLVKMLSSLGDDLTTAKEAGRYFHRNTVIGELRHTWLSRRLAELIHWLVISHMVEKKEEDVEEDSTSGGSGGDDSSSSERTDTSNYDNNEAASIKMAKQMLDQMPLRSLVLFSEGNLRFTHLDTALSILNHSLCQCGRRRRRNRHNRRITNERNDLDGTNDDNGEDDDYVEVGYNDGKEKKE